MEISDWVIVHRPGIAPDRKGPFADKRQLEKMLCDLYALYPDCVCTVIAMPDTSYPQSGREWLNERPATEDAERKSLAAWNVRLVEYPKLLGDPKGWLITGSRTYQDTVVPTEAMADKRIADRGVNDGSTKFPLHIVSGDATESIFAQQTQILAASRRLLAALDRLDEGCREPGFNGFENGNGEQVGDEVESARQALKTLIE